MIARRGAGTSDGGEIERRRISFSRSAFRLRRAHPFAIFPQRMRLPWCKDIAQWHSTRLWECSL
jgi:hypothetical protein